MSVNLIYAIDQRKVAHKGRYFGSIDFEVAACPNKAVFDRMGRSIHVGVLTIGGRNYRLNLEQVENLVVDCYHSDPVMILGEEWTLNRNEVDRLVETLKTAKHVFFQRYRLRI